MFIMDLTLSSVHFGSLDKPMNAGIISESRDSGSFEDFILTLFHSNTDICKHTQYNSTGNSEGMRMMSEQNIMRKEKGYGT